MSQPARPETEKEQLAQIWYALIGMNGDGLISKVNRMEPIVMRLEDRMPLLMTHEDCRKQQDKAVDKKSEFHKFWLALIITNVVGLAAVLVAMFK